MQYGPSETQARLALYDADSSDRLTEEQLIGTAVVDLSVLTKGDRTQVPLQKDGKAVSDCYLLLNPSDADLLVNQQPAVAVAAPVASGKVSVKLTAFGRC